MVHPQRSWSRLSAAASFSPARYSAISPLPRPVAKLQKLWGQMEREVQTSPAPWGREVCGEARRKRLATPGSRRPLCKKSGVARAAVLGEQPACDSPYGCSGLGEGSTQSSSSSCLEQPRCSRALPNRLAQSCRYFLHCLLGQPKNASNILSASQCAVYCTRQGRWTSIKLTIAFRSRQKWKINVHRVISAMPWDTKGFYMTQTAYENCPCSISFIF